MIVNKTKETIAAEIQHRAQFLADRYDDAMPIHPVSVRQLDAANELGLHWAATPANDDESSFVEAAALEVAALGWDLSE